jgi:hypothetical protein
VERGSTGVPGAPQPLVMIPAFVVPMSLLVHALSLRQLRQ